MTGANLLWSEDVKQLAKRLAPAGVLRMYRSMWSRIHRRRALNAQPETARELYRRSALLSYEDVVLPPADEAIRQQVMAAAVEIYGANWNYYSDALRPEIALGFVQTVDHLGGDGPAPYLEIGSCQGLSMSFIALLLRSRGRLGRLVSIDPYFEGGYNEGALGPYQQPKHVPIGKETRNHARELYERLGVPVELLEMTSDKGLASLLAAGERFRLIYIDGYHEKLVPTIDFGLSHALLEKPGVIILDDYMWPDVLPLKQLCDKHANRIQETWKTASYVFAE